MRSGRVHVPGGARAARTLHAPSRVADKLAPLHFATALRWFFRDKRRYYRAARLVQKRRKATAAFYAAVTRAVGEAGHGCWLDFVVDAVVAYNARSATELGQRRAFGKRPRSFDVCPSFWLAGVGEAPHDTG